MLYLSQRMFDPDTKTMLVKMQRDIDTARIRLAADTVAARTTRAMYDRDKTCLDVLISGERDRNILMRACEGARDEIPRYYADISDAPVTIGDRVFDPPVRHRTGVAALVYVPPTHPLLEADCAVVEGKNAARLSEIKAAQSAHDIAWGSLRGSVHPYELFCNDCKGRVEILEQYGIKARAVVVGGGERKFVTHDGVDVCHDYRAESAPSVFGRLFGN